MHYLKLFSCQSAIISAESPSSFSSGLVLSEIFFGFFRVGRLIDSFLVRDLSSRAAAHSAGEVVGVCVSSPRGRFSGLNPRVAADHAVSLMSASPAICARTSFTE